VKTEGITVVFINMTSFKTSHSARPVWHYVGSSVPFVARPKPRLPIPVYSMRAGASAPTSTSIASPPVCLVSSAQSVYNGVLPAGPANNGKRQFCGLYSYAPSLLHLKPSLGHFGATLKFGDNHFSCSEL